VFQINVNFIVFFFVYLNGFFIPIHQLISIIFLSFFIALYYYSILTPISGNIFGKYRNKLILSLESYMVKLLQRKWQFVF